MHSGFDSAFDECLDHCQLVNNGRLRSGGAVQVTLNGYQGCTLRRITSCPALEFYANILSFLLVVEREELVA